MHKFIIVIDDLLYKTFRNVMCYVIYFLFSSLNFDTYIFNKWKRFGCLREL